jgi:hypothetical protein
LAGAGKAEAIDQCVYPLKEAPRALQDLMERKVKGQSGARNGLMSKSL